MEYAISGVVKIADKIFLSNVQVTLAHAPS